MVTPELLDYIRYQRNLGKNDDVVRDELLRKNFDEIDVDKALTQVVADNSALNTTPTINSFVATQYPSANTISPVGLTTVPSVSNLESEPVPSKSIKLVSVILSLISVYFFINTISFAGKMYILSNSISEVTPAFSVIKTFPFWILMPILYLIATLIFAYLGMKVCERTRLGWILGMFSVLIIPSVVILSTFVVFDSTYSSFSKYINAREVVISPLLFLLNPAFILSILALSILSMSYQRFNLSSSGLSKKSKIALISIFLILMIPSSIIFVKDYMNATNNNFNYDQASQQVDYKIYKSKDNLLGIEITTNFEGEVELAGKNNAVKVAYDMPIKSMLESQGTSIIILKQVGVEPNFDIVGFLGTEFVTYTSSSEVDFSKSKSGKAYLIQNKLENIDINYLSFVTIDNVLIVISSPHFSQEDLIAFANTLN